jgi:hypothetical protein
MSSSRHYTKVIMDLQPPVIDCRGPQIMQGDFLDFGFPASHLKNYSDRFYRKAVSSAPPCRR